MKKTVIVLLIIAAAGALIWWLKNNLQKIGVIKDGTGPAIPSTATLPIVLPPTQTPPINAPILSPGGVSSGLYQTDSGPGRAAIERRVNELIDAGFASAQATATLNPTVSLFDGVQYMAPYFLQNIAASTGAAGAENVPLILNSAQRAALSAASQLKYIGPGFWADLGRVANAAIGVRKETGVRFLGENDYDPKNLDPYKRQVLPRYTAIKINPGQKDTGENTKGTQRLINDVSQLAKNWITLSDLAVKITREKAIQDLRQTGWRFVGYDSPN